MNDILIYLNEKKDRNKTNEGIAKELGLTEEDYQYYINEIVRFCRNNPPPICHYMKDAYDDGDEVIMDCNKSTEKFLNAGGFLKYQEELLEEKTINQNILPTPLHTSNPRGKIFISHCVEDVLLVQKFTEDILEIGLGIKTGEEVFNISIEGAGINNGEDFKKRIEAELKTAKIVIQIITENYKKSEACLNEMGAAWILGIQVIPFILEPISYNTVGFIHNTNQQLKINNKEDILSFVSQNKNLLHSNYNDTKLHRKIDEFLKFTDTLLRKVKNNSAQDSRESTQSSLIEEMTSILKASNPKVMEHLITNESTNILLTSEEQQRLNKITGELINKKIMKFTPNGNMIQNRPDGLMRTGFFAEKLENFNT